MARGETKLGYENLQNSGVTTGSRRRGGAIIPHNYTVEVTLPGATAATSANWGIVWTCPKLSVQALLPDSATKPYYELVSCVERHETAGSDGSAVSLMLAKVPSGTAKSAGTNMLSAGMDMKAVADTNVTASLHATLANIQLAPGDSVAIVPTGVLTALAGVSLELEFRRI